MRKYRLIAALILIFPWISEQGFPDDNDPDDNDPDDNDTLMLTFDKPMSLYTYSTLPTQDRWTCGVTRSKSVSEFERDPELIRKYITPQGVGNACRLQSKRNFVVLFRLIDPSFKDAHQLSWKWSASKHPFNGTAVGHPNDQSAQVLVVFRRPESTPNDAEYSILSFVWTATNNGKQLPPTYLPSAGYRLPTPKSPSAQVKVKVLNDGNVDGLLSREVDLRTESMQAYGKAPPPIWGLLLMADSDESKEAVPGEMITDAIIQDVRLSK